MVKMATTFSGKTWLLASEAAELIGVTTNQVNKLIHKKKLSPAKKLGDGRTMPWLVCRKAVIAYRDKPYTTGRPRA